MSQVGLNPYTCCPRYPIYSPLQWVPGRVFTAISVNAAPSERYRLASGISSPHVALHGRPDLSRPGAHTRMVRIVAGVSKGMSGTSTNFLCPRALLEGVRHGFLGVGHFFEWATSPAPDLSSTGGPLFQWFFLYP